MHRHHHQFNRGAALLSRVEGSPPAGVFAVVSENACHHIRKSDGRRISSIFAGRNFAAHHLSASTRGRSESSKKNDMNK